ncbi:MAG: translation initiation factor IF-2, partial [Gemmatimonadota bacterium]
YLTVAELAELIDESASDIIGSAFKNLGLMVTINQRLDYDQIELLLEEFGYEAVLEQEYTAEEKEEAEEEERPEDLQPRPPVVTVMGHVDHGKTLLLDHIRKTNVVAGESGGITQHIGAYKVQVDTGKTVTFLDTPGHAAFTAMRSRGADLTDIVILVVAADDSVMPQTIEAISHARNAGVPLIVAINKIDLPTANAMKVKQELLQHEVTVEEFGGDVLVSEVSAKTGEGVDALLEQILLQAELLELKANPDRDARGTVVEAQLDVGKGPVVTVLVQNGTLRVGDSFLCGLHEGRVRAMLDERGHEVKEAGPGTPVQVLGAGGVPQAGDTFSAMDPDRASEIAATRQRLEREKQLRVKERGLKLGDLSQLMDEGQVDTLPLVIKGDVDGSVQALADSLEQLSTEEVQVEIIHRGVGAVNESDVLLAQTAGAVIVGFRVRPDSNARQLAERSDVDIQSFDVIYEAVDQVRAALEGMLAPEVREEVIGSAEVRETFRISGVGTVAGCYVTDGRIERNGQVRLVRDGIVVYNGEIDSLKRFKDDVREVREGYECGLGIANFNDVKVGDVIECYKVEEVARTLAGTGEARG